MAVARMLKVSALGHRAVLEDVVAALQRAGVLQVSTDVEELAEGSTLIDEERLSLLEERLAHVEFVRQFLSRFREPEQAFSTFISEKVHLDEEDFLSLEYDDAFLELYEECQSLSGRLATIERDRERLNQLLHDLEPWRELHLQIERWKGTERVSLFTGTISAAKGPDVRAELREAATELSIEELGAVGSRQAWVVMVVPESEEEVRAILSLTDFEEVTFPGLWDYPAEEIADAEQKLEDDEVERVELDTRATELTSHYEGAVALGEALASRRRAITVRDDFGTTERAFAVQGWVPETDRAELETCMMAFDDVDLVLEKPGLDEEPPVMLENRKWLRPFEVLTDLYGRPRYADLDPTPLLAGFFFLFFGLCIGDVGYGVTLLVVAWLIKNRLDVAPGVRKFMDLLMYGGVSSIAVGALTGSYFAIETAQLPGFLRGMIVLEPMVQIETLLVFTVILGVIQLFFGVLIKGYRLCQGGDYKSAFFGELSTFVLWGGVAVALLVSGAVRPGLIGGLGLSILMKGLVLTAPLDVEDAPAWDRAVGWGWVALLVAAIVSAAAGVFGWLTWAGLALVAPVFVSRAARKGFVGVLVGAYNTYDTAFGFVADALSYTRLAALGLASVLVGWAFNVLAGLIPKSGAITTVVFGTLAAVLILLVGHALNLVVNLLGAFVHPLRLQYVEFFSKFYEGGGHNYSPFGFGTRSLVLRRERTREEGSAG